jgi:hypothetical protein
MFRKISPSRFNTRGFVMIFSTESQRRLIWHGMFLFLLGLLMGFAKGQVINPRMDWPLIISQGKNG